MASETKVPQHAALLASPGMGHVIPLLELGRRLVSRRLFASATVFVVSTGGADVHVTRTPRGDNVDVVALPDADVSGLVGPSTSILVRCKLAVRLSLPGLRSAISGLAVRPAILVVDQFGTEAHAVESGMRRYVFLPCSAWFLALTLRVPVLDRESEDRHVKDRKPLAVPGCEPVRFECMFEPVLCRESDPERFSEFVRTGVEISMCDGILVNTWHDLEPKTLRALGRTAKSRIFPIGPVVRPAEPEPKSRATEWLDMQPDESVIYVSFGSGGTMSAEQTNEIAWGLESSQHRFIWVARPPFDIRNAKTEPSSLKALMLIEPVMSKAATFFAAGEKMTEDGTPDYFPDGFLTRTKEVGLVITKWAPQSEIMAHPSIGGFITHCGWNSTLESLVNGVPMIAWPLYAEQKMNAVMLVEHIGVAMQPEKLPTEKVVRKEEIEKMVRGIMERGSEMRTKTKELKKSAEKALRIGGSSYESICKAFK